MALRIINMHEIWYELAKANENKNDSLESIDIDGTPTARVPNNPMLVPEFIKDQAIVPAAPLDPFDDTASPDEIRLQEENNLETFFSKYSTHFVNDSFLSVPLWKASKQVVNVIDPVITITFSLSKFVTKIKVNGIVFTGNPVKITETIGAQKLFNIEVFTADIAVPVETYGFLVNVV